jgi:hypothetical protein
MMSRTLLVLALLPLLSHNAPILLTSTYNPPECTINSSEFWEVCETHFLLVEFLTILVLQTEQHKLELNYFTEALLKVMSGYEYPIALKIEEYFLSEPNGNHTRRVCDESIIDEVGGHNMKPVEYETLARIKRLSSDSLKGYFIIVWDVATLHQFLDDDYQIVIPEARATYSLHFVFTSSESCHGVKYELSDILKRFWIDYNVVNVIAQTPCSCDNHKVYIYRPFVRTNSSWGITNVYTLQEINNNYRLITNLLDNLNQFPLKIALVTWGRKSVLEIPKLLKYNPIYKNLSWSKGFAGLDGFVMGSLAESLNFDVVVLGNPENSLGMASTNKPPTGCLRDVVERRAVFGANSRFLIDYSLPQIEFTVPHSSEELCMVVPKAAKMPNWASIFNSFTTMSWTIITLTCIICTIFWYCISSKTFAKASWTMFSILMGTPTKIVPKRGQSQFLAACMIFNIVILGVIQGSLFKNFTTISYHADINTLKELDESGLPIATSLWSFIRPNSELLKRLEKKTVHRSMGYLDTVAYKRNVSVCEPRAHIEFLMKTKYVQDDGLPLLHIINECLTTFLMTYVVRKGSAFLTVFNNVIAKVVESGLTVKWNNDIVDSLAIEKIISLSRNRTRVKSFSLYDVQSAFYLIIIGYIFAILLFLCEMLYKGK